MARRMSRVRKLREKIMGGAHDRNVSFAEAEAVLKHAGFVHDGGKGSHRIYRRADGRKLVLPFHAAELKPVYVKEIRKTLT